MVWHVILCTLNYVRFLRDDKLFELFGVKEMTYFTMQTLISPHIEKSSSKRKKPTGKKGVSGLMKPQVGDTYRALQCVCIKNA